VNITKPVETDSTSNIPNSILKSISDLGISFRILSKDEHFAMLRKEQIEKNAVLMSLKKGRVSLETATSFCYRYCDSYSRLKGVLDLRRSMHRNDWLQLIGETWETFDNLSSYLSRLHKILGSDGPLIEMMNEQEQTAYEALPDVLEVYRGCGSHNIHGASWSLDRAVAERFPTLNRYRVSDPLLVTASVEKRNVLALKLGREEHEVVTFSATVQRIEALSQIAA
jgi:hypothetical protein